MAASGSEHSSTRPNDALMYTATTTTTSNGNGKPLPTRRRRRGSAGSNGSSDKHKHTKRRAPRCFGVGVGCIPTKWLVDYRRNQAQFTANSLLRLQTLVDLDKKKNSASKPVVDTGNTAQQQQQNLSRTSLSSSISSSSSSSEPPSSSASPSSPTKNNTTINNSEDSLSNDSEHSINLNQVFTETKNDYGTAAPTNYENFSISIKIADEQEKIQFLLRNPEVVKAMRKALQDKSEARQGEEEEDEFGNTIQKPQPVRKVLRREIKCIIPNDRFQLPQMQMVRQGSLGKQRRLSNDGPQRRFSNDSGQKQQRRFSNDSGQKQQRRFSNATAASHQSVRNPAAKLHCIEEDYEVSASEVPYDASADKLNASHQNYFNSSRKHDSRNSNNNSRSNNSSNSKNIYNDNNASKNSFFDSCNSFALDSLDSEHETTNKAEEEKQEQVKDSDGDNKEDEKEAVQSTQPHDNVSDHDKAKAEVDRQVEEILAAVLTNEGQRKKIMELASSMKQVDASEELHDEEDEECFNHSIAENSVQSSVADISVQTSVADTSVQTSVADTSVQTSVADTSVQTSVDTSVQTSVASSVQHSLASTVADTVAAVVTTLLETDDESESDEEEEDNYVTDASASDACYESQSDFEDLTECEEDHTEFAREDEDVVDAVDATENHHLEDVTEGAYDDVTEGAYDDESEFGDGSTVLAADETEEGDYEGDEEEADDPADCPLGKSDQSDAESDRTGAEESEGGESQLTNNTEESSNRNHMYGLSVYLSNHSTTRDRMVVKGKGGGCGDSRTSITESLTERSAGMDGSSMTHGTNKTSSTKGTHRTVRSTGTIRTHRSYNSAPTVRSTGNRTHNSAPSVVNGGNDSRSSMMSSKSELDESNHTSCSSINYEERSHASRASSAPLLENSSRAKSKRRPSLMLGDASGATAASGSFITAMSESDHTIGSAVDNRRRRKPSRTLSSDAGIGESGRRGSRRFAPGDLLDKSGLIPRSNTPQGIMRTRSGLSDEGPRPRRLPPRNASRDSTIDVSASRRIPARSRSMLGNPISSSMDRSRGISRSKSGARDSFMGGSKIKRWDNSNANANKSSGLSLLEKHLTQGNAKKVGRGEKRPSTASRRGKRRPSMSVPALLEPSG